MSINGNQTGSPTMKLRPRISRMSYSPDDAGFYFSASINDTANTLLLVHSGEAVYGVQVGEAQSNMPITLP